MTIELKIPAVGESISEAVIGEWLKHEGETVLRDEPIVVIETDKVNVELPAPESGTISKILKKDGEEATVGEVIGLLEEGLVEGAIAGSGVEDTSGASSVTAESAVQVEPIVMPAAARALAESGVPMDRVVASGPGGRVLKEDVERARGEAPPEVLAAAPAAPTVPAVPGVPEPPVQSKSHEEADIAADGREHEVVKMTLLRRKVAERLVSAQQSAALLSTFNEVDMSKIIALRTNYRDAFLDKHGVKLGFMSFFVKAAVEALREVPQVNASIRGSELVFHNYQDIGIAVGGGRGLVVPVVRNAERLGFAEIEKTIADFGRRARDNKLELHELQGGTFTISNGGIYGSLLSTPIVNPPQSGILGMHKIEERPIAIDGQVVVRPMMYLALTYDHRIIDGREAVTFLVKIKEKLEEPTRILLEA